MNLAMLPFISSWTTFDYNGMDFSGALEGSKGRTIGGRRDATIGRVVFTQPRVALPLGVTVDPLAIVLKDGFCGFWIRANLSDVGWRGHKALMED